MKIAYLFFLSILAGPAFADSGNCPDAETTLEMNACLSEVLKEAEQQMRITLAETMQTYQDEGQVMEAISDGQHNWQSYRDSHCRSLYEIWRQGSIRNIIYLGCAIQLTESRTRQLEQDYLKGMDSAVMPAPKREPERPSGSQRL